MLEPSPRKDSLMYNYVADFVTPENKKDTQKEKLCRFPQLSKERAAEYMYFIVTHVDHE
jgi:hypothetical protein